MSVHSQFVCVKICSSREDDSIQKGPSSSRNRSNTSQGQWKGSRRFCLYRHIADKSVNFCMGPPNVARALLPTLFDRASTDKATRLTFSIGGYADLPYTSVARPRDFKSARTATAQSQDRQCQSSRYGWIQKYFTRKR